MNVQTKIDQFLDGSPHAVVGASRDRNKYGNKVLRSYLQNDLPVFVVNPSADDIEGQKAYADLSSLPGTVHGISVITQPYVTEEIVEEAARLGIRHIWMQPGSESEAAIVRAESVGMTVIAGGPCILVALRYREV